MGATIVAESAASPPQQGLLVLNNGSILEGVVSEEEEHFRVMLPNGELLVRTTEVDFFCHNIKEAYYHRRERHGGTTADSHLEVVRWCLQHGLLDQAEAELEEASSLEPRHRLLEVFARQIEHFRAAETQTQSPTKIMLAEPEPLQLVSNETDIPLTPEIPQWARVEFVRRIQPMLVHTCATGGCHVPGSKQRMLIDREALAGIGSPELIQQNLDSVVRMISTSDSDESLLITKGTSVHGLSPRAQSKAFTPRQVAILRAWLTQLTDEQLGETSTTVDTAIKRDAASENSVAVQQVVNGADPSRYMAKDPFDPKLFNREYAEQAEGPRTYDPIPSATDSQSDLPPQEAAELPRIEAVDSHLTEPSQPARGRVNKVH
ncbi:hypothetical protein [Bythopirellula polymerisocia]|nr:hypothetical protein [Bythopirellula polymerisocia]